MGDNEAAWQRVLSSINNPNYNFSVPIPLQQTSDNALEEPPQETGDKALDELRKRREEYNMDVSVPSPPQKMSDNALEEWKLRKYNLDREKKRQEVIILFTTYRGTRQSISQRLWLKYPKIRQPLQHTYGFFRFVSLMIDVKRTVAIGATREEKSEAEAKAIAEKCKCPLATAQARVAAVNNLVRWQDEASTKPDMAHLCETLVVYKYISLHKLRRMTKDDFNREYGRSIKGSDALGTFMPSFWTLLRLVTKASESERDLRCLFLGEEFPQELNQLPAGNSTPIKCGYYDPVRDERISVFDNGERLDRYARFIDPAQAFWVRRQSQGLHQLVKNYASKVQLARDGPLQEYDSLLELSHQAMLDFFALGILEERPTDSLVHVRRYPANDIIPAKSGLIWALIPWPGESVEMHVATPVMNEQKICLTSEWLFVNENTTVRPSQAWNYVRIEFRTRVQGDGTLAKGSS